MTLASGFTLDDLVRVVSEVVADVSVRLQARMIESYLFCDGDLHLLGSKFYQWILLSLRLTRVCFAGL